MNQSENKASNLNVNIVKNEKIDHVNRQLLGDNQSLILKNARLRSALVNSNNKCAKLERDNQHLLDRIEILIIKNDAALECARKLKVQRFFLRDQIERFRMTNLSLMRENEDLIADNKSYQKATEIVRTQLNQEKQKNCLDRLKDTAKDCCRKK